MTCKICQKEEVEYHGGICGTCIKPYHQGEIDGRNRLITETVGELNQLIRMLNERKI